MRKTLIVFCAIGLAVMGSSTSAASPPDSFGTHLSGSEEVPARETRAQGQAIFKLLSPTEMSYRLIASNIDNVVASHIHCGDQGTNGPVVQFLFGPQAAGAGRQNGVLATGTFDPSTTTCAGMSLTDAMRDGHTYVNVHTNDGVAPTNSGPGDFPGGEIRGQIRFLG